MFWLHIISSHELHKSQKMLQTEFIFMSKVDSLLRCQAFMWKISTASSFGKSGYWWPSNSAHDGYGSQTTWCTPGQVLWGAPWSRDCTDCRAAWHFWALQPAPSARQDRLCTMHNTHTHRNLRKTDSYTQKFKKDWFIIMQNSYKRCRTWCSEICSFIMKNWELGSWYFM